MNWECEDVLRWRWGSGGCSSSSNLGGGQIMNQTQLKT